MLQLSDFLKRIEHLLVDHDMDKAELSRAAGMPEGSLGNWWKKGRKRFPTLDDAYKVAKVFDVSLEYLLTGNRPTLNVSPKIRHVCGLLESLRDSEFDYILSHIDYLYHKRSVGQDAGGREGTA